MNATRELSIDSIRIDGGTQSRLTIDEAYIAELMEVEQLPPPIVFIDGANHWLADGFHRFFTAKKAGKKTILCVCRHGTKRDAVAFSLSANATHGLKRSIEDKQKSVQTALADSEWSRWSDRQIADLCKVSHTLVARMRRGETSSEAVKKTAERNKNPDPTPKSQPSTGNIATASDDHNDSGNIQQEQIAEIIQAVSGHGDGAAAEVTQPKLPWSDFEAEMRDYQTRLRAIAKEMAGTLGYDSKTKQLDSKWANFFSHAGTIGHINQLIRVIDDGMPVEESRAEPCGYVSKQRQEILKKATKAA